jgi:hypothetical protein
MDEKGFPIKNLTLTNVFFNIVHCTFHVKEGESTKGLYAPTWAHGAALMPEKLRPI